MKKVLVITYYFPPAGSSGVQRPLKFVKFLPLYGYQPVVLTVKPSAYKRNPGAFTVLDPSLQEELASLRLKVYRTPSYEPFWARRVPGLPRLISLLLFVDRQQTWIPAAVGEAITIARRHGVDLIYTSGPPHSVALIGLLLRRRLHLPWVADFRDPWVAGWPGVYSSILKYQFNRWLEARVVEEADAVIMNTPTARENLLKAHPQVVHSKVYALTNGYDEADFTQWGEHEDDHSRFRIVHTGVFYSHNPRPVRSAICSAWRAFCSLFEYRTGELDTSPHSPVYLLRALSALHAEHPDLKGKIEIVFAGVFDDNDRRLVSELRLNDSVRILGYVPHAQSVRLLQSADVSFLTHFGFPDGTRNPYIGGKTYEYMASGKPILALLPEGDAKDFVRQSGLGIFCPQKDVEAIKNTLLRLYKQYVSGGITVSPNWDFIPQFERRRLTRKLGQIFDSVIAEELRSDISICKGQVGGIRVQNRSGWASFIR